MSGDHNSLAKFEFGKYSFCSSPELCSYLLQLNVETSLSYDKIKFNVMLKFLQENNCIMKKFNFINVLHSSFGEYWDFDSSLWHLFWIIICIYYCWFVFREWIPHSNITLKAKPEKSISSPLTWCTCRVIMKKINPKT
jgi:hypothetical protein